MKWIFKGSDWRAPVISLVAVAQALLLGQQLPVVLPIASGTSSIGGHVTDSISKAPIAGCQIEVIAPGPVYQRAALTTGPDGSYVLSGIAANDYSFFIQCPAHLPQCLSRDSNRCFFAVARDQERSGIDFSVVPAAVARGQVMTFDGRPVTRAKVRLGRGMQGASTYPVAPSTTDTEGRFELINLPAGEWRLEVEIPPVPGGLRPPIVYYPGGISREEAVGVVLVAGQVTEDLNVVVPRINENVLTIVVPRPDATISNLAVSVLRESPLAVRRIQLNADGVGAIKGVVRGRYFVAARAASRDKQWAGFEVVDVIDDNYEARLQLKPTGGIAGRIVADKGRLPSLEGVIVGAAWIYDGAQVNPLAADEAPVGANGSFRVDHLFGTRQLQLRGLDLGWEVAAVRQRRTDVTTSGLAVVPGATIEATIVLRRRR